MKIIGTTEIPAAYGRGDPAFVAIISLAELAKVADKAGYNRTDGPAPKVGEDYPIAEGYDFRAQLLEATRKMAEAYTAFAKVAPVAAEFAGIVQRKAEGAAP